MSDDEASVMTADAVPIGFKVNQSSCFGWFHAAGGSPRNVGVVMCRPLGFESMCSYGAYTQLAEALADAGFDVIRFDYQGTGDSAGEDTEPDRVQCWIDSVTAATTELRRLSEVIQVSLFGLRMGATLAVQAAMQLGGVQSMVMWAPCVTGRAFVRELRAASSSGLGPAAQAAAGAAEAEGIEGLGFFYSKQTLEELGLIDCQNPAVLPAPKVLILGRDDLSFEGPLPGKYAALGIETAQAVVPGYSEIMVEARERPLPPSTLGLITDWLAAAHPLTEGAVRARQDHLITAPTISMPHGVNEVPVFFGCERLFGILSRPGKIATADLRGQTAVLMLNVGGNYRIGPNRIYVRMARALAKQGYRTLRFDLSGLGDSRAPGGFVMGSLYSRDSTGEVMAAIDLLASQGCTRFFLLGICSGSFVAFQTAQIDPRVTGQILMNSRLLEWHENGNDIWQISMQRHHKSTNFYMRQIFNFPAYRRLLRGEVDVQKITLHFWVVAEAKFKRAISDLLPGHLASESLLVKVRTLEARGLSTFMIVAAEDDGRDYVEYHFGTNGSRMHGKPGFRMLILERSDHTFSDQRSQRTVISAVIDHLEKVVFRDRPEPDALDI